MSAILWAVLYSDNVAMRMSSGVCSLYVCSNSMSLGLKITILITVYLLQEVPLFNGMYRLEALTRETT